MGIPEANLAPLYSGEVEGFLMPILFRLRIGRPLHAARLAIRFDVWPTRSALEPRDLVALGCNRSLQCRHLFQKLQNQVLQLGRRQTRAEAESARDT